MRITVLTHTPSYHQVDLFDEIAKDSRTELKVLYVRRTSPGRQWSSLPTPSHPHEFLPVTFHDSALFLNPTILFAIRKARPELLVVCQYSGFSYQLAMIYASLLGTPWVFWSENPGVKFFEIPNPAPEKTRVFFRKLATTPLRWANEIWGIGQTACESYQELTGTTCKNLPYFSDLSPFNKAHISIENDNVIHFLFAGSFSYRKGFDLLLEAFEKLAETKNNSRQNWTLTVCGDGVMRKKLNHLTPELDNRTNTLGFCELDQMPAIMGSHDVLIAPSRYDGWGMVVPEAMAATMMVIGSKEMGSIRDIGDCEGILPIGANNMDSLYEALLTVLEKHEQLLHMQEQALRRSVKYDVKVGAQRFIDMAMAAIL